MGMDILVLMLMRFVVRILTAKSPKTDIGDGFLNVGNWYLAPLKRDCLASRTFRGWSRFTEFTSGESMSVQ